MEQLPPLVAAAQAVARQRQLFGQEPRLVATEVVLPNLRHSLLVGTRIS